MRCDFPTSTLRHPFRWWREPRICRVQRGLPGQTGRATGFWQRTPYGFQQTTGHALLTSVSGDLAVETAGMEARGLATGVPETDGPPTPAKLCREIVTGLRRQFTAWKLEPIPVSAV